jgi:hypothetical protein
VVAMADRYDLAVEGRDPPSTSAEASPERWAWGIVSALAIALKLMPALEQAQFLLWGSPSRGRDTGAYSSASRKLVRSRCRRSAFGSSQLQS